MACSFYEEMKYGSILRKVQSQKRNKGTAGSNYEERKTGCYRKVSGLWYQNVQNRQDKLNIFTIAYA